MKSQFAQANSNNKNKGEDMKSTKDIYELTQKAIPDMTVRRFSRYCGKSEGYYGSLIAQNLDLSTNALIHLAEVLTYKQTHTPCREIKQALITITEEIADRMQHINSGNIAVRRMIIKAVAAVQMRNDGDHYTALPVLIG